jgi:integrase
MPRRAKGPRLWLDPRRRQWVIRDGKSFVRTGCSQSQADLAEKLLAKYLARKYEPPKSDAPPVADILLVYLRDRVPTMKSRSTRYNVSNLAKWWGDKTLADVTAANCRAYAATKTQAAARSDLEKLSAAIKHWHREIKPLAVLPHVSLPPRNEARERWLTRSEAARLLWAARRTEHLKRFIMLGLHTGSRSGVIRKLQWSWIDFGAETMRRRAKGVAETKNKRTPPLRIPRKLLHFLRRWKSADRGTSPFVVNYMGKPIRREPHTAWKRALKLAGLSDDGVMPHTLRHTRGTWMMQRRVDPWQAAGFLGMTVRMLEQTYGHHHPDWQEEAANI